MEARFPLFGGWKTQFYQGYSVPVQELLRVAKVRAGGDTKGKEEATSGWIDGSLANDLSTRPPPTSIITSIIVVSTTSPYLQSYIQQGDRYMLTVPFSVPYSEVWVSDLTVKVVLPEWARDIKLHVPFDVEEVRGGSSRLVSCGVDYCCRSMYGDGRSAAAVAPPPSHDMVNE